MTDDNALSSNRSVVGSRISEVYTSDGKYTIGHIRDLDEDIVNAINKQLEVIKALLQGTGYTASVSIVSTESFYKDPGEEKWLHCNMTKSKETTTPIAYIMIVDSTPAEDITISNIGDYKCYLITTPDEQIYLDADKNVHTVRDRKTGKLRFFNY